MLKSNSNFSFTIQRHRYIVMIFCLFFGFYFLFSNRMWLDLMTVLVELNLLLRSERMCLLHVHVCNAVTANQSQSHCICAKHLWMRISAFLCPSPVLKFEITILYKIRNQICCNKTWRCFVIVLPITHCFRLDISRPSPSYHIVRKSIHLSWFWTLFVTYINVFYQGSIATVNLQVFVAVNHHAFTAVNPHAFADVHYHAFAALTLNFQASLFVLQRCKLFEILFTIKRIHLTFGQTGVHRNTMLKTQSSRKKRRNILFSALSIHFHFIVIYMENMFLHCSITVHV